MAGPGRCARISRPHPRGTGVRHACFGCGEAASSRPGPRHRPAVAGGIGLVAPSAALHQKISSLKTTLGVGRTPPDAPHRCQSAPCGPRTCSTSCTVACLASLGACFGRHGGQVSRPRLALLLGGSAYGGWTCGLAKPEVDAPSGWRVRRTSREPHLRGAKLKERLSHGWPPHSVWRATQGDPGRDR